MLPIPGPNSTKSHSVQRTNGTKAMGLNGTKAMGLTLKSWVPQKSKSKNVSE